MRDLKFVYIYPLSTLLNISLVLDLSNKFCSIIFISLASGKKKKTKTFIHHMGTQTETLQFFS